ncbi:MULTISPECIES: stress response translation initiation inhibitor YciH [Desulfurococcus]|jgi:translation initiation factor 1|uniref:Protein translation factor SUI1 homolog n=2 Tax=Desulfurococcus amylolyticus TaxID=94694 RepID=B8D3B3_DESA1|nr:stress response translation initiation inhibitor YciH [Desulfurococcus amylolyticus]ACL10384.1 translation initiation factor 1 (eIF-1/SUI1) [Desulfurococcus amylolyticus 1221n]AFL66066.1 translation initiation factor SUI1 [Desulfurococcus amylolyticus DSM 16532]
MDEKIDESICGGLPPELCEQSGIEQSLVKIRLDTRKFGKAVTIIDGLPNDKEFLKQVAKALKTKLATGGTFKEGRIELQGDHRHRVKQILIEEFGIPPENILVID